MFRTILFRICLASWAFLQPVAACESGQTEGAAELTANPGRLEIIEGATARVLVRLGDTAIDDWDKYDVDVAGPSDARSARKETDKGAILYFQAPVSIPEHWSSAAFTVTVRKKGADSGLTIPVTVIHEFQKDWDARAIIGWHQAGASSAESSQNLFFDFFVARPLGLGPVYNSSLNLWGQVRVASSPQQRSVPLSQFAIDFTGELGKVSVNELAQSAEFLTGIEIRPFCKRMLKRDSGYKDHWYDICRSGPDHVRTLSFVAFFGANGAFSDPATAGHVFRVPSSDSPQWGNFVNQFPSFEDPAFAAKSRYVGLVPPDRERFYREYGAGIRYTSYSRRSPGNAPAMYTATIGQDQSVTNGRYAGPVLKFDAFYPLPFAFLGGPSFIYLFGTANLAVAKPRLGTPLALELEPSSGADAVKLYQNDVAVFAVPSSRDTYRIGIGIDFLGFLKSLPTSKKAE